MSTSFRARGALPRSFQRTGVFLFCIGAAVLLAPPVVGKPLSNSNQQALSKALKKSKGLAGEYGIHVADVETGETLFEVNGQQALNLASNGKLISTAAAIARWGSNHRFETQVYGALDANGVVNGHLYLRGGGDPGLHASDMESISKTLYAKGVRKVTGSVVVDDSVYGSEHLPPAYDQKQTDASYRSSAGALNVNHNTVAISFRPGKSIGAKPIVGVRPGHTYPRIKNTAKTVKGKREGLVIRSGRDDYGMYYAVTGTIGKRGKPGAVRKRVDDPGIFAGGVFLEALRKTGIEVANKTVLRESVPSDQVPLQTYASQSLLQLITEVNETSNNMMAETLFLGLGTSGTANASWSEAQKATQRFLEKAGLPAEGFTFLNGSGLYDADFLSANQMTDFLQWSHRQEWGVKWRKSLPVGGKTGTLSGRLKGEGVRGRVFAKTGTLNEVVTLSGYIETRSGRTLAFAFLFNDVKPGKPNLRRVRRIQDALCGILGEL